MFSHGSGRHTLEAVRQLTNLVGAVTDTYEYDAFGNELNSTGTTPNEFLYRGEQYDSDLGLYYLRARYYNPTTGRFMSRDPNSPQPLDSNRMPVDPTQLHKYLYVGGDPVDNTDPTGRAAIITYTVFLRSQIKKATVFGTINAFCIVRAFLEERTDIAEATSGEDLSNTPNGIGAQLASCEAIAVKSMLGTILAHIP